MSLASWFHSLGAKRRTRNLFTNKRPPYAIIGHDADKVIDNCATLLCGGQTAAAADEMRRHSKMIPELLAVALTSEYVYQDAVRFQTPQSTVAAQLLILVAQTHPEIVRA